MSFFLDANVLIYSAVDSEYRVPCLEILEAVAERRTEARISTAVFEEVWHIESSGRVGRRGRLSRVAGRRRSLRWARGTGRRCTLRWALVAASRRSLR